MEYTHVKIDTETKHKLRWLADIRGTSILCMTHALIDKKLYDKPLPPITNYIPYTDNYNSNIIDTVYFISDGEYIKIGKSINPEQRMTELQTGNARKLELLAVIQDNELKLHKKFNKHHVNGEWFCMTNEILDYIDKKCMTRN